jgi:hypothetical protein
MSTSIITRAAVSEKLFGGSSNPHYADDRTRIVAARIETNSHGEHVAQIITARSIDYAGTALDELLVTGRVASSPVFTVVDDAIEWAAKAHPFVVENVRSGEFDAALASLPVVRESHSRCPECDRFDTLSTSQQAWCDVTTCSTPGCSYENVYMIGD